MTAFTKQVLQWILEGQRGGTTREEKSGERNDCVVTKFQTKPVWKGLILMHNTVHNV